VAACPTEKRNWQFVEQKQTISSRANIADDPDNPKSQFIIGCMATKGYDFSVVPSDCDSRYPFPTQAGCYVPNSWIDWMVDKFRTAKEAK
jgi:hypothetical protein